MNTERTGSVSVREIEGSPGAPAMVKAGSDAAGENLFMQARQRLLDVNGWEGTGKPKSLSFELTDNMGRPLPGPAISGNYIKILPGDPANLEEQGCEWVQIEKIEYRLLSPAYELFVLQARACADPVADSDRAVHLFGENTTSSFIIERDGQRVSATVYGKDDRWRALANGLLKKGNNR